MKNNLKKITFAIGIVAAIIIYFISKTIEAPLVVFILSIAVATYQYIYLPWKYKKDDKG